MQLGEELEEFHVLLVDLLIGVDGVRHPVEYLRIHATSHRRHADLLRRLVFQDEVANPLEVPGIEDVLARVGVVAYVAHDGVVGVGGEPESELGAESADCTLECQAALLEELLEVAVAASMGVVGDAVDETEIALPESAFGGEADDDGLPAHEAGGGKAHEGICRLDGGDGKSQEALFIGGHVEIRQSNHGQHRTTVDGRLAEFSTGTFAEATDNTFLSTWCRMGSMTALKDQDLATALGPRAKILAQGRDADGQPVVVGTVDKVAVKRDGEWVAMGWHEVERGSWRAEKGIFRWTDMHGEAYEASLERPGQLPMLFQERVQASTVGSVQHHLDPGEVRIIVRRSLGTDEQLQFFAVPSGGARLTDPMTAALVVEETDRLKAEYGLT